MVQIDIQKFDWAMRCGSTLPLPLHRKRFHQPRQRDPLRLLPIQERLDDIRRQQRQPQQARDIGRVDLLGRGKNGSEVRGSISTHDIPGASRARVVDARPRQPRPSDEFNPARGEVVDAALYRERAAPNHVGQDWR